MLSAVLNGKRRGTGVAGKHLVLSESNGAEDVLTATVFERVAYLPNSVFFSFMEHLLALREPIGALDEIQFWPSWSLAGDRVEPDVVLFGSTRILLIEAKRSDTTTQQYAAQLARELLAGWEADILDDEPVLLTVGGLQTYSESTANLLQEQIDDEIEHTGRRYELVCRSWLQVYQALKAAIHETDCDSNGALRRLLQDIAETYEWLGLRTYAHTWLAQFPHAGIQTTAYPVEKFNNTPVQVNRSNAHVLEHSLSQLSATGINSTTFPIQALSTRT